MKSKQVILELQSNRLDIVQFVGGRCAKSRRIAANLNNDPHEWMEGVAGLAEKLGKVVEEMGLKGQTAIVLYSSPTQVVELVSTEVKSASDACEVARLRCIDSLPFSSLTAVCDSHCIGRDNDRTHRKLHVLAVADREDILSAMSDLVENAGLRFQYATPIASAIFQSISAQAIHNPSGCLGHLFIGERHSYFLISDTGRIVFSRLINIGIDALARSLTRPIKSDAHADGIELDLESARRIIYECGIPGESVVVDETLGLTSRQIIPLMQPVLQRLLVELRQSMRFGLTETQRSTIELQVSGPGCSLKGIHDYLEDSLDIKTKADVSYAGYDYRTPGAGGGELLEAIRILKKHSPTQLQPESHAKACRLGKLRQWLWAGAAAAILMISLDGIGNQIKLEWLERQMITVEGLSSEFELMKRNGDELRSSLIAMRQLEKNVQHEVGAGADYRSAMHELARLVPENLRFVKIAFNIAQDTTSVTLTGYAFGDSTQESKSALQTFMDRLQKGPLFFREKLISVQTGVHEERQGQRFEIGCKLIHVPRTEREGVLALAKGESSS